MIKSVSEFEKDKLLEAIKARRSVRTFDGNGLAGSQRVGHN